ncbi:MAG: 3-phosphoshikimate 1-carboxyvinyltransferase, partial [Myxococcota bacterium]
MTTFIVQPAAKPLMGYVLVPGDKSIAHRALLFGALADGEVRITGMGSGGDNRRSARAMASLGAEMRSDGEHLVIHGAGLDGLRPPGGADEVSIDCGNSGTTIRLLCGLLAGQSFTTVLHGDESLSGRPMRRVTDPLGQMGATITGADGAKPDELYPPLRIAARSASGPERLSPIDYALPMASAQVKSAVILAGLYADGVTTVREPGPSRDHTEQLLAHMGAPIQVRGGGVIELDTRGWDRRLACERIAVPKDPSQAAFVLCAALVAGVERVTAGDVCINPTRTGFLDILGEMGARVEREAMSLGGGEATADLSVSRGAGDGLSGVTSRGDVVVRAIDELPILSVVAARAGGVTHIHDAAELRVKESDRIAT